MRPRIRIALIAVLWLLGAPVGLVGTLIAVANTDAGRRLIERSTDHFSDGKVVLQGLAGRFPDQLRLAQLKLSDPQGVWLEADALQLRWQPLQLLQRHARIELLQAARVALARAPHYAPSPPNPHSIWRDWLHELRLDRFELARLELAAPLAGSEVALHLQGSTLIKSWQQVALQLSAQRLDAVASTYRLTAQFNAARIQAQLDLEEGADGPLTHLAQVPGLGALSIHLTAAGVRAALALNLSVRAGTLQAAAQGSLNLPARAADMQLTLDSAAMSLRPDVSWQRASLRGRWRGSISAPDTDAHLELTGLTLGATRVSSMQADLRGAGDALALDASLTGLILPKPALGLLQDAPVSLHAQIKLGDATRPLDFSVSQRLLNVRGHWQGGSDGAATLAASLTDLKPFAALIGLDLQGRGTLQAQLAAAGKARRLDLSGAFDVGGGSSAVAALLSPRTTLSARLALSPGSAELQRAELRSPNLQASVRGGNLLGALDLNWNVSLPRLAVLSAALAGTLSADGQLQGTAPRFTLAANAAALVSAYGTPPGTLKMTLRARNVPQQPVGHLELGGSLDQAPLHLGLNLERAADGEFSARIERADWKSAHAGGSLRMHLDGSAPAGHVELSMSRLADLDRLLGQAIQGGVDANVDFDHLGGHSRARVSVDAKDVGMAAQQLQSITVRGDINDLTTQPSLALQLSAQANLRGVDTRLHAQAHGALAHLNLSAFASSASDSQSAAQVEATATLLSGQRALRLMSLQAQYRQQSLRLLAPALLSFGDGLAVDHLRLGAGDAVLLLEGRLTPTLQARASLRNFSPALLRPWLPDLDAQGRVDADAELHGSLAQPLGSIRANARALRASSGDARGLPPTDIQASAQLAAQGAQLEVKMQAGNGVQLQLSGQAPFARTAPMALKMSGAFSLALINPIIEAGGQRLLGQAQIDGELDGTLAAPQAHGSLTLTHADLQDYARGVHLSDISASVIADGNELQLKQLSAHARSGTISASGTLQLGEADLPIEVTLSAHDAQPLASDLLTATIDANLKFSGTLRREIDATGTLRVSHADINIPNALPPNIEVLNVVRPGQKVLAIVKPSATVVTLNLSVNAPRAVFVRGRGLDAEVGGELHVRGTSTDPDIDGGFDLRNGTFSLAGTSLTFTSGRVSFNGNGVKKKIDPTLDFTASNNGGGVTETLNVGGYTDAPVITLTSTPEMPQDEILSRLLFGVSVTQLTALQIAQIGAALVTMSGVGGGGFNPINAVQRRLRLDRLAISGGTNGSSSGSTNSSGESSAGATIEAGRYVSNRVYVGAKQNTNGPTQAQVQVDLTKRLKVQTTLGTGGGSVQGATPQNDPGSSIGLSYQFEY